MECLFSMRKAILLQRRDVERTNRVIRYGKSMRMETLYGNKRLRTLLLLSMIPAVSGGVLTEAFVGKGSEMRQVIMLLTLTSSESTTMIFASLKSFQQHRVFSSR